MNRLLVKKSHYNFVLFLKIIKKKKIFVYKNKVFFNNLQIVYHSDKNERLDKRILLSNFYYVFKRMENMSGNLAFFKTIKIRIKNKKNKKKLRQKSFLILACNLYKNIDSFFDFFIINNYKFKVDILKTVKKKYRSNQEFYKKNGLNNLILNKNNLLYRENFFFKSFAFKKLKKSPILLKSKLKKIYYKHNFRCVPLQIHFKFSLVIYIYKFFSLLILNYLKLFLFLFKFYRNKLIKI